MQTLRQSVLVRAPPADVQRALLDSASLTQVLGHACVASDRAGGSFRLWDGLIEGANAYVRPGEIVQLWRYIMPEWPVHMESHLTIRLGPEGTGTRIHLDQDGIPDGCGYVVEEHWRDHVWPGLKALLEKPERQEVGVSAWLTRRRTH